MAHGPDRGASELERNLQGAPNGGPVRSHFLSDIAVAVLSTGTATFLRLAFDPFFGPYGLPYITFYGAVAFAAWYAGIRSGILTSLASLGCAVFFFIPPRGTFKLGTADEWLSFTLFAAMLAIVLLVSDGYHDANRRATALLRERDAALASIMDNENRLKLALEAGNMGTWDSDLTAGKITWSENHFRLLGYQPSESGEATYDMWVSRIHSEDRERVLRAIEEARASGSVCNTEYRIVRADNGTIVWLSASGRYLYDSSGKATRFIGAFSDITKRKQAEDALRKAEKLAGAGRMAASVAHEINNPLASLVNTLYLLEQEDLPQSARGVLQIANSELDRVIRITKQTLAFYRASDSPSTFDLMALTQDVISFFRPIASGRGVSVEFRSRPVGMVQAYAGEIRQVLVNLLSNALESGCTRIRVSLYPARSRLRPAQRGVRLSITDNGKGIPRDHLERVFEPFFTTKGEKGTGLGLWVTRGIVTKHDGEIRVRSNPRHGSSGTCVSIFLPTVAQYPPSRAESSKASQGVA